MGEGRIPNSNLSVKTFNVGGSYGNKQSPLEIGTFAHGQAEMIKIKVPEGNQMCEMCIRDRDNPHPQDNIRHCQALQPVLILS